ncbi:hypothetical protein BC831DRAFT_476717 [Entophlyctis helioformis]|nr:hypothetical protein BC831DRAFT_476717 [Entophlyctis helioformis]
MNRRPEAAPGTKCFVGNLSWGTDNQSLYNSFGQFGTVTDAIVLKDRETGRSRGFGFVTFATPEEANAAIASMDNQELDGRQIRVNLANDRPAAPRGYGQQGGFQQRGYGEQQGGYNAPADYQQ